MGYGQYQTTDHSGGDVNPVIAARTHYKVNALGFAFGVLMPERKVSIGVKFLNEFANGPQSKGTRSRSPQA